MAWGQPEAALVATPNVAMCEFPNCDQPASLSINIGVGYAEIKSACCGHAQADGVRIVRAFDGAEYNDLTRDLLLKEWQRSKETLDVAKASEMSLRKAVGAYVFPNPNKGVNNHELGGGAVLKYGHKLNHNLKGDTLTIEAVEDAAAELGNEGKFLIERIIVWKADFSLSEYNKLDTSLAIHANVKKLVDTILEITPASPTLEIKEPKA